MMEQIEKSLREKYPDWNIYLSQSGRAIWVDLDDGRSHYFILQIVPGEIGFSIRKEVEGIDFSGHDESFACLEDAINHMGDIVARGNSGQ